MVPEEEGESVDVEVLEVADGIETNVSLQEIDRAHRLGKPKDKRDPRLRDIIIKFVSYRSRQKLLLNKRKLKDKDYN